MIYGFMCDLPMYIDVLNLGTVASMGIIIYLACNGRQCLTNSKFIFHTVRHNTQFRLDQPELEKQLINIRQQQNKYNNTVSNHCQLESDSVFDLCVAKAELDCDDACKYGIVHNVFNQDYVP